MNIKKRLFYSYLIISVFTIVGFMIRYFILFPEWPYNTHLIFTFASFLLLSIVCEFHFLLNAILNKYIPFEKKFAKRIIMQLLLSAVFMKCLHFFAFPILSNMLKLDNTQVFSALTTVAIVAMSVLINAIIIAVALFNRWKESLLKAERLEKEKALVQFDALKNQLNPHFLFNALTALNGLVNEDKDQASNYIQHLSKVYRYVLQNSNHPTVSLKTEIDFLKNYLHVLNTRYGDALKINIDINDNDFKAHIVPVTLQILIENAIKHNVISSQNPLVINITTGNNCIMVENNLQKKSTLETSNKQGLEKLKSLYSFLSDNEVECIEKNSTFKVKLPLLD